MDASEPVSGAIESLLAERLQRMKRFTGFSVVFGGATRPLAGGPDLVVSRAVGAIGSSLRGLVIRPGWGLGGTVLSEGRPLKVSDYAASTTITHDYDRVVRQEGMTSVLAVPLVVGGTVHGLLYGAVRGQSAIGDRGLSDAVVVAQQFQRDVEKRLQPEQPETLPASGLEDLAALIRETDDPALRTRLLRIQGALRSRSSGPGQERCSLGPRELDALRLVAVGASNVEIAAELGLRPQTVKAYLRSAMRKLDARSRTAAVHAARIAGLLD